MFSLLVADTVTSLAPVEVQLGMRVAFRFLIASFLVPFFFRSINQSKRCFTSESEDMSDREAVN